MTPIVGLRSRRIGALRFFARVFEGFASFV